MQAKIAETAGESYLEPFKCLWQHPRRHVEHANALTGQELLWQAPAEDCHQHGCFTDNSSKVLCMNGLRI